MKTFYIKYLILLIAIFSQNLSNAGIDTEYRKNCTILAKYKVKVAIWKRVGNSTVTLCTATDKGCSYAAAACNGYIPNARADVRIGSNPYRYHYYYYPYYAGNSFVHPPVVSPDTLGIGIGDITEEVTFNTTGNNTEVTINGFSGRLAASVNSQFGTCYRILIWKSENAQDSIMSASKVLMEASIRIENGAIHTTGFLSPSDFTVTTVMDASGFMVTQIEPVVGLQKVLQLPYDDADNSLAVRTANHGGFGYYDPNAIFENEVAIPTLTEWGLILLTAALVLFGIVFLLKRSNYSARLSA